MSGALVAPGGFSGSQPSRPVLQAPLVAINGVLPDFQTHADAERAFMGMLTTIGVTKSWTWEQTMRETITEPMYKALNSLSERKDAFIKYVAQAEAVDKAATDRSLDRARKNFFSALDKLNGGPTRREGIKVWWNFENRRDSLAEEIPEVWSSLSNDTERKILFDEYISALKTKESVRHLCAKLVDQN